MSISEEVWKEVYLYPWSPFYCITVSQLGAGAQFLLLLTTQSMLYIGFFHIFSSSIIGINSLNVFIL